MKYRIQFGVWWEKYMYGSKTVIVETEAQLRSQIREWTKEGVFLDANGGMRFVPGNGIKVVTAVLIDED